MFYIPLYIMQIRTLNILLYGCYLLYVTLVCRFLNLLHFVLISNLLLLPFYVIWFSVYYIIALPYYILTQMDRSHPTECSARLQPTGNICDDGCIKEHCNAVQWRKLSTNPRGRSDINECHKKPVPQLSCLKLSSPRNLFQLGRRTH